MPSVTQSIQTPRDPGLREKMELALDQFEELSAALTRLQERLEWVSLRPPGEDTNRPSSEGICGLSQAEITLTELLDRIQTLTVRVNVMADTVRI
jgi:hypothetical protein